LYQIETGIIFQAFYVTPTMLREIAILERDESNNSNPTTISITLYLLFLTDF